MIVPLPSTLICPVPLMTLLTVNESERLKARTPSFITDPLPGVPDVPPLPIWSVPASIEVVP